MMQLHIFCYFAAGMLMSLWVWNARSLTTWKQFFRSLRKCKVDAMIRQTLNGQVLQLLQGR
jgi:hypothetical protein